MRKYRHRQSGAILATEKDMPIKDWEPIEDGAREPKKPAAQKRKGAGSKAAPKE